MTSHEELVSAIRDGKAALALQAVEPLLKEKPDDAQLLSVKALALAMTGQKAEAAKLMRRAMECAADPVQKLKYAGNLARLLAQSGRWREAAALASAGLPPASCMAGESFDSGALQNLAMPLLSAGEADYVAGFLRPLLDHPQWSWELELIWLRAASKAHRAEDIYSRVTSPSYRWRNEPETAAFACAAALQLKKTVEARQLFTTYLETAPPYISPHRDTQILTIVLISPDPMADTLTYKPENQHFHPNFPSQLQSIRSDRYRFMSVFVGSKPRSLQSEIGTGEAAVTLNNCVNGENLRRGEFARVEAHEVALGLPLVNSAAAALRCTRQETAEMLSGIPNLIVPKIMRLKLEPGLVPSLRAAIKDAFEAPVLLRTVGEQEASHLHLAGSESELESALSELAASGEKDLYAIAYRGVKHRNGLHRRLRAAYVEGTPTLMRADYDSHWIVKGRKTESIQAIYKRDRSLLEQADSLLRQPQQLGAAAWDVLMEIGRRIPLDIFGLDFDVDAEGRVIFFESNATMNLLSNAPAEIDYPAEAQHSFLERLDLLLRKRAGLTLQ